MIIKDDKNRAWIVLCIFALVLATAGYLLSLRNAPNGPNGGSISGLTFGILGSLMMVFAALLGARKLVPSARLGSAQFWLRGHIWLGLLSVPFILFHSGFSWGGPVEILLWISFGIVVLSGLFGVIVQNVLPRVMTESVPLATFVEQIPFLSRRFQAEGDCLVAQLCGRLDVDFEPIRDAAYEFAKSPAAGKLQLGKKSRQDDFEQKYLPSVYAGVEAPEKAPKRGPAASKLNDSAGAAAPSKAAGGKSVLEQARAAAKPAGAANDAKRPKPDTGAILEKARSAAKPSADPTAKPATSSILEQARAAAAAKKQAAAESAEDKPEKPKQTASILDQARAAAKKPPAAKPDTAAILAKAREAASAKATATAETPNTAGAKPGTTSILEQARAAAKKPSGKPDPAAMLAQARAAREAAAGGNSAGAKPVMPSVARATSPPVPPAPVTPKKPPAPLPAHQIEELKHFYLTAVRPFLAANNARETTALASAPQSRRVFEHMREILLEPLHEPLDCLESFCEQQRQFRVQQQLHRWLHSWLMLHIPVSMALMILFLAHVLMALRVVPFSMSSP